MCITCGRSTEFDGCWVGLRCLREREGVVVLMMYFFSSVAADAWVVHDSA